MKKVQILSLAIAIGAIFGLSACLKKSFDNPPDLSGYDPKLPVNMTIANLKSKFTGTDAKRIDSNWTIVGIVNADDRSGNFYKQINIEDSTGGITILIDNYNLYTKYPVGRKVYINLKGLYYGYYSKFPQLGGAVDNTGSLAGIAATSVDSFVVRANYPNPVPTHKFSDLSLLSNGLNTNMIGRLVEIDSVEVADADMSKTYAQPATVSSGTSINIEDCFGSKKIAMRSSAYAKFQAINVPKGRGKIIALYTNYNTTPQLVIRDTTDLAFYSNRCGGGTIPGTEFFTENFNSATSGNIALAGWTNYSEAGTVKWTFSNAGSTSNPYAKITAYKSTQASVISWLITPAINLAGKVNPILTFKNTDGFNDGATLKVYISTNYNGSNPTAATWTQLNANISTGHASGFGPFVSSGNINLSAYTGNVHIAFKYEGGDPGKTTTYEIDDVKLVAN